MEGVTGQALRAIVVLDECKEQFEETVKNWPHPFNEIPVMGMSEWAERKGD